MKQYLAEFSVYIPMPTNQDLWDDNDLSTFIETYMKAMQVALPTGTEIEFLEMIEA